MWLGRCRATAVRWQRGWSECAVEWIVHVWPNLSPSLMWLGRCRATAVRWQRGWWGWSPTCLEATPWWKTWTTGVSCLFRWGTKTESWGRNMRNEWLWACMVVWPEKWCFILFDSVFTLFYSTCIFFSYLCYFDCSVVLYLGFWVNQKKIIHFVYLLRKVKLFSIECYSPLSNTFAINPSSPPPPPPTWPWLCNHCYISECTYYATDVYSVQAWIDGRGCCMLTTSVTWCGQWWISMWRCRNPWPRQQSSRCAGLLNCWRSVVICPVTVYVIKLLKVSYNYYRFSPFVGLTELLKVSCHLSSHCAYH